MTIQLCLLAIAAIIAISGYLVHQRAYLDLYRRLSQRGLADESYRPDWSCKLGALGCMGFVTKIKRDIGISQLSAEELALMKRSSRSYLASVPPLFLITGLLYWTIA